MDFGGMRSRPYGAMDLSFLEYGVPNEYILEALAHQYNLPSPNQEISKSPPKHRHDGTSPLPLGMDWSPPPRNWDGRCTVWPHDARSGWSYCVTIPSWTTLIDSRTSGSVVYYRVQVGIQTPKAITTTRGVLHRFSDFLNLLAELKKLFPKKSMPVPPPRKLLGTKSKSLTEERKNSLEDWIQKLLSDIDISRSAPVAIFLELEAAVRSSFNESSGSGIDSFVEYQPGSDGSSVVSDYADDSSFNKSEILGTPKGGHLAEDGPSEGHVRATSNDENGKINLSEEDGGKVTIDAPRSPIDSVRRELNSPRSVEGSNWGEIAVLGEGSLDFSGESEGPAIEDLQLPKNLIMALPSEQRLKFNRVLITMEQRLASAKADMEDLVARLNQEVAVRQFLTTKVTDLEVELETTEQSAKDYLQQATTSEKERFTQMQWDMEESRKKCLELEMKLKTQQDEKMRIMSENSAITQDNETLKLELHSTREQLEKLQKLHEEAEMKSKTDVKVLVKEVKSLRSSQSELKQELSKVMNEKLDLEKDLQNEKQIHERANSVNEKLLHECVTLQKRLRECSVNILVDEEGKLVMDTSSLADATDLLSTSDNRIGLLLAEAQLLAQDVENAVRAMDRSSLDELRKMITDVFIDNAKLRKQINAVIRCTLKTLEKTEDEEETEASPRTTTVLGKYL